MLDAILNVLFPTSCVLCQAQVLHRRDSCVCAACWSRLAPLSPPFCTRCGEPAPAIDGLCGPCRRGDHAFDLARSAFLFDDALRGIIHAFKYADRVSLARPLGALLKECLRREGFEARIAMPVPLHPARARSRGFNQADLLARQLGLPVEARLLRRKSNTPSQTGLSRSQRILNLTGAFEVRREPPDGVLIIDDVYTTGSTVHEMARTLKRAGTVRVEVLTVARVPRPD